MSGFISFFFTKSCEHNLVPFSVQTSLYVCMNMDNNNEWKMIAIWLFLMMWTLDIVNQQSAMPYT